MAYDTIAEGGGTLTQGFGCSTYLKEWSCGNRCGPGRRWHAGIDVGVRLGTALKAVGYGRVVAIGDAPSCGGPGRGSSGCFGPAGVCIRSGNVDIWYAHCSAPLVSCGQQVVPGQRIAYSGTLGCSTGPHVHFEVDPAGVVDGCQALDPRPYLSQWPGTAPVTPVLDDPVPVGARGTAGLLLLAGGAALVYAAKGR